MPSPSIWRQLRRSHTLSKARWLLIGLGLFGCFLANWCSAQTATVAQAQTIPAVQLFLPVVLQTSPPVPDYAFNVGLVERCDPNAGITYVNGTTAQEGAPVNGAMVAFSYAPDGPIVAKIESGPHPGYPNRPPGFFSHILGVGGPRAGDWYFWIVDEQEQRISVLIYLQTDGQAGEGQCQQGLLRFDQQAAPLKEQHGRQRHKGNEQDTGP